MKHKKLFLLDAMALIYRAYYAMIRSPRVTSKGLNTSAIFGFTNTLYEVIRNENPTHLAVSFDTGAPTLRHAEFEAYKAHRESTPEDIVKAIPYIYKLLEAFNIPILVKDGYEADDIIGTLAKKAETEGFDVYMMTSDKDYGQLVSEHVFMYKPGKFGQKAETIGVKEICEKYGIEHPEELIDILGLWGDASDNIPGVPNIGEVKAKKLIQQFHSIENIYQNLDEIDNDKLRQTLTDYQEQAYMSKMLATIMLDVPIDCDCEKTAVRAPNFDALRSLFHELEFRALGNRILMEMQEQYAVNGSVGAQNFAPSNNPRIVPDLFNQDIADDVGAQNLAPPDDISIYKTFKDKTHDLIEWDNNYLPQPNQSIFFEWIYTNDVISGFAFSENGKQVYYHDIDGDMVHHALTTIFETPCEIISFQTKNIFKFCDEHQIDMKAIVFDLQVAHYLIQPEISHQLERITESYLEYELINNEKVSTQKNRIEATCEKVEIFVQLFSIFKEELKNASLEKLFYDIEMPLTQVLADMERTGIKIDKKMLEGSSVAIAKEIQDIERQIFELSGTTFNIASPKQLGEILFEKLRIIENAKLTKTKQYQTGEEILQKLYQKHPIIPLILEWRSLTKLKSTYIDALPQLIDPKTDKIHTTFQQTVTSTGRLSSINPNLQNIPIRTERGKEIRKAFVPSSGKNVLVSADYSQVELRIVAAMAKDESMTHAFQQQQDIHAATASQVFHVPLNEVTKDQRRYAKTVNFGILYGMSAFGLADRLHIPQGEARQLIADYNSSFPKIEQFMNGIVESARKNGYVETLLGRRRYIRDINSGNGMLRKSAERNAINAPIQGTAADVIKMAMIRIYKELKNRNLKSKMVLQVHDELVFDVPMEELDIIAQIVPELMSSALEMEVPLVAELSFGRNWYEAH
ncbi:MAG: DNA polymerase I [Bacteroidetes bacterium]|nr:DNA polymerase I [Bacteroidota bacterium]MCL2303134.1 DNA polymerase I [Lentimicrobiaceae bacterium]